jgi:hypothetical protein
MMAEEESNQEKCACYRERPHEVRLSKSLCTTLHLAIILEPKYFYYE